MIVCLCSLVVVCLLRSYTREVIKGRAHAPVETSEVCTLCFPAWPAAALTTSHPMAASSQTAPGGGRSHATLEPSGLTLVGEQLGILLVGGESSQLSQGRRLRCQWTWVTGRSPPLPTRGKELSTAIGQRGDKEILGRARAGRQSGHNGVELPSEPDSGSAGSSSCVSICSRYISVRSTLVVLAASSNFNTVTPCGRAILGR